MVRVEFRSFGPSTCSWCGNDKKDVFTVVFDDGSFDGPVDLCFNDFRRATQLKLARAGKRAADRPAPPADGKA